jgi:hypothetical protein
MASRTSSDQRSCWLSGYCLAVLLCVVASGMTPGSALAGSGTTCFAGMHYSSGAAGCAPQATGMLPSPGGLPGPGGPVAWSACVSAATFSAVDTALGWGVNPTFIAAQPWWMLRLLDDGFSDPQLIGYLAIVTGPCNPGAPPAPGNPIIYLTFDSILAFAPEAFWGGTAACPAGDQPDDACPPSVGNPVQMWVAGFASARGPTQTCSRVLSPFWYFTSYQACLRWRQRGAVTWDFNDETNGTRIKGQNYGVVESGTGAGSALTHTFDYSSGYDPIRNCVRPCSGEALGPPLPGHAAGSPAFQVTISSVWEVELQQCFATGGPRTCTSWQVLDLRTLGSPAATFTATSLIPVPVVEYGATPP